jgi:pyruvate,water dikinase
MRYTIPFSELSKTNIAIVGGKGANLGEMTTAGFPVPPGFVLTTAAYDAIVQAHDLQPQIVEWAKTVSSDDAGSSETASDKIKGLFLGAEVPQEIVDALMSAHDALGGRPVAVRSSATAEDLPTASFAGQQDTFLNIKGQEALLDAVKRCWASLWTARAISYRLRQGINPDSVSLAVVVQQLIKADSAGILFTANPLTGDRGQLVINATWGLGEAIVGGQVTPDTFGVNKSTFEIESQEIATKKMMTERTESGTEERAVPVERQKEAVLDGETAVTLAKIGAQIDTHYDMPMDIEWAIADDEIFITQARPITSLPPAPLKDVTWESPTPGGIWMRRQIVEHMPEPLSPLFADLYVEQGLAVSISGIIDVMSRASGTRIVYNEFMPYGFAATINGFGYSTGTYKVKPSMIKLYGRIFRLLKRPELDWEEAILPGYQETIARWDGLDLDSAPDDQLLEGIRELSAADSIYWFWSLARFILSRVVDTLFDRLLKSILVRSALPKAGLGSSAFLRGFDSRAMDAQADSETLAENIGESEALRELVLNTSVNDLLTALAEHPAGQPVLDDIHDYLAEYGHQIYNLDYIAPTQNEDPLPVLLSLQALVKSPPVVDVRTRQRKMTAEREALVEGTASALNPISRRLFRWAWKWTEIYAPYREQIMFYMGAAWPTVRRLAAELGGRLAVDGAIAKPDDIYYLNSGEITAANEARAAGQYAPNYGQLVKERRDLRAARMQLTPPPRVPERSVIKLGPIELKMLEPTPRDADTEGAVLNGFPVSTGRVTAPASVILDIEDFDKMQPNTILVCTTTTPAWTPLLSQSAGLVTDVGGALAHGSIVAREYGIPAVMGTGAATERIRSGMMLVVDGDAGTVTLLDEVDELK